MNGGPYQTVLADPPWMERGAGKCKRGADRHYKLMSTPDIIAYLGEVPLADSCHMYLWVTNSFLPDGLRVMEALGIRYITNLVWVKDRFGLGQYFRGQHELLLFGVKGRLPYKLTEEGRRVTIPSVIAAKRREHSRKPDEQYGIIERTSYGPYLEVFAKHHRQGWDVWGDEAPESIQAVLLTEAGDA